jgi:hypothetical protein
MGKSKYVNINIMAKDIERLLTNYLSMMNYRITEKDLYEDLIEEDSVSYKIQSVLMVLKDEFVKYDDYMLDPGINDMDVTIRNLVLKFIMEHVNDRIEEEERIVE